MSLVIIGAPTIQLGLDEVSLAPVDTDCTDDFRSNMTFVTLKPINGLLNRQSGMLRNWTTFPPSSGTYKVCYYLGLLKQWYFIAKPGLISIIPTVTMGSQSIVNPYLGKALILIDSTIFGVNFTGDVFGLIQFGQQCNKPVNMILATGFWYVNESIGQVRSAFLSSTIKTAGDYTLCFKGFPHRSLNGFVQVSAGRVRLVGSVTQATLRTADADTRVGRTVTLNIDGVGMSVRDSFFLTNASDGNAQKRCQGTYTVPGDRVVTPGQIRQLPGSVAYHYTLTNLLVDFTVRIPYTATLCYKSNTSKLFLYVTEFFVRPVMATAFTPNATAEANLVWANTSDVVLSFFGIDLLNTFDTVLLLLNTTAPCDPSAALDYVFMAPYSSSSSIVQPNASYIARGLQGVGTWSVCYRSNVSLYRTIGTISVVPRFYDSASDASTRKAFFQGLTISDVLRVRVVAKGFTPLFDLMYVIPSAMTCTSIPPSVAISPSATTIDTVEFPTTSRGYFWLCWVLRTGSVVTSERITIFQRRPTLIQPSVIGIGQPTSVQLNEVMLLDGDTVSLCNTSIASRVVVQQNQVILLTVNETGSFDMCYQSALSTPAAPVAQPVAFGPQLGVSPFVVKVSIFPPSLFVGTDATIYITGIALDEAASIYLCNESLAFTANFSLMTELSNSSTQVWTTVSDEAGSFQLCYSYGVVPSFPDGPLLGGSVTLNVDPASLTFSPFVIAASIPQTVTIAGTSVRGVYKVFIRLNASVDCSLQTILPTDYFLTQVPALGVGAWNASVRVRGTFAVCFSGFSGHVYSLPSGITIAPHLDNLTTSQSNSVDGLLYAGYPLTVTVQGGALDYSRDSFSLVSGSSCASSFTVVPLTASQPPLVQSSSLVLSATVPTAGSYRLCYAFGSGTPSIIVPYTAVVVVTSLVFIGNTLTIVGPAAKAAPVFLFSFSIPVPGITTNFTSFAQSSSVPSVTLKYVPFGVVYYRATLLQTNGVASLVITIQSSLAPNTSLCTNFPQSLANTDIVAQFSSSFAALFNYLGANCAAVVPTDYLFGPSLLLSQLLNLVGNAPSLVTDSYNFLSVVSGVSAAIPQGSAAKTSLMQGLLSNTANLLQVPDSLITVPLLQGQLSLVSSVFTFSAVAALTTTNPSTLQALSIAGYQRLQLIATKYCSTGLASGGSGVNVTSTSLGFGVKLVNPTKESAPVLALGSGSVTSPQFWASLTTPSICVMGANTPQNIFPQVTSSTSSRVFSAQDAAIALPSFNFPLMTFTLPVVSASSANAFQSLNTVQFQVSYPPIQLDLTLPFLGYTVAATFYRFSPGPTGTSTQGAWVQDTNAVATADATTITVTYLMNQTSQQPLVGNYFVLSGTYTVSQTGAILSPRVTDIYYAVLTGLLVLLHVVGIIWGIVGDRRADKKALRDKVASGARNPLDSTGNDETAGISIPKADEVNTAPGREGDAAGEKGMTVDGKSSNPPSLIVVASGQETGNSGGTATHEPTSDEPVVQSASETEAARSNNNNKKNLSTTAVAPHKQWNVLSHTFLHRYMSMWTRSPLHPISTWARVTAAFTYLFSAALFTILVLEAAPWSHGAVMNIAYGIAAAVIATPFSIFSRVALLQHLRDYVSGAGAVFGIAVAVIGTITYDALVATVASAIAGYVAMLLAVALFARRWSFTPLAAESIAPKVLGITSHLIVEGAAVGFVMYRVLVVGIPREWASSYGHLQTFAWAVVFDCVVAEPIKGRAILFMESAHVSYIRYYAREQALQAERAAAREEKKKLRAQAKAEEAARKAQEAQRRNPYEVDDDASGRPDGGDDGDNVVIVEPKQIEEILESEDGENDTESNAPSRKGFDSIMDTPLDEDDDYRRRQPLSFSNRPPTFASQQQQQRFMQNRFAAPQSRGAFLSQKGQQNHPELLSPDLDEVSDFPDESELAEEERTDAELSEGEEVLRDAAPAPFNTRPMLVFNSEDERMPRRSTLRLAPVSLETTTARRDDGRGGSRRAVPRLRSAPSLDEITTAAFEKEQFGDWIDSDDSSEDSAPGDWEEFRIDDEGEEEDDDGGNATSGADEDRGGRARNPLDQL